MQEKMYGDLAETTTKRLFETKTLIPNLASLMSNSYDFDEDQTS